MRQIILDTETTGLDPAEGHRIIEIGCLELINRRPTSRHFHHYLQPDCDIDPEAIKVHGITNEFLQDKPRFADIAEEFIAFIQNAEIIIHNAPFDTKFINAELEKLAAGFNKFETYCRITDTLQMARARHPGQKNSLDALCKRYHVDNSQRTLHGALLDAQILADVYLAMTGGQVSLLGEVQEIKQQTTITTTTIQRINTNRPRLPLIQPNATELAAHEARLTAIDKASGGKCLWKTI